MEGKKYEPKMQINLRCSGKKLALLTLVAIVIMIIERNGLIGLTAMDDILGNSSDGPQL